MIWCENGVGKSAMGENVWTSGKFIGTATSAQLSDLAEKYTCKNQLPIGTIVTIGEDEEFDIETCTIDDIPFGIISDKPGFILDENLENSLPLAMIGKTPVLVKGSIKKGQPITLGSDGTTKATNFNTNDVIMGRSLETIT